MSRTSARLAERERRKHFDEDGLAIPDNSWCRSGHMVRSKIVLMIERLSDDRTVKQLNKLRSWDNPMIWDDGCCNHYMTSKNEAMKYWQDRLKIKDTEITTRIY